MPTQLKTGGVAAPDRHEEGTRAGSKSFFKFKILFEIRQPGSSLRVSYSERDKTPALLNIGGSASS
jgi:hypothetical protein